jgi:large subunit ribosomal protein L9
MKVIFIEDVPHVAKSGQMKEVADGYARNYLIPRKLAMMATQSSLNAFSAKMEARARSDALLAADNVKIAEMLNGKEIFIAAKSGGKERLYGSVTSGDITAALQEATGLEIDKRKIKLSENIHQTGTYDVEIKLGKDINPVIKVTVTGKPAEESK